MSKYNRAAIMQPYFLPYIGYWQLMHYADVFVVYDDIQFTKKGWINRNRYLQNGTDVIFSLPIKKDSDYLNVVDRFLSENIVNENKKTLRKLEAAYKKSPYFQDVWPIIEECFLCESKNLFEFVLNSIKVVAKFLQIETDIVVSSSLGICKELKGQERVIETCKKLEVKDYLNPIGGVNLYCRDDFESQDICLYFQNVKLKEYRQLKNDFVPGLSIIDILMFNGVERTKEMLSDMELS